MTIKVLVGDHGRQLIARSSIIRSFFLKIGRMVDDHSIIITKVVVVARSFFDQWSLDQLIVRSKKKFGRPIIDHSINFTQEMVEWSMIERSLIEKWSCDHDHFCYFDRMVGTHSTNFQKKDRMIDDRAISFRPWSAIKTMIGPRSINCLIYE